MISLVIPRRNEWESGFLRLCEHLTTATGLPVRLEVVLDFDEARDRITAGAGMAVLTSTGYVQSKRLDPDIQYLATAKVSEAGSKPVSRYSGAIIVRKDSGIADLEGLRGKPFAFVNQASSSGFRYPVVALDRRSINYKSHFGTLMYLGDHSFVTDAIASGLALGGATWDGNLAKAREKHGDVFLTLETFGPIVNHAIVAGRTVPISLASSLAKALLSLPSEVVGTDGFPYAGFEVLDDNAYDEARQVEQLERRLTGIVSVRQSVTPSEFRTEALKGVLDLLREVRVAFDRIQGSGRFVKREPTPLLSFRMPLQLASEISVKTLELAKAHPGHAADVPTRLAPLVDELADIRQPLPRAVDLARNIFALLLALLPESSSPSPSEFTITGEDREAFGEVSTESLDLSSGLSRAFKRDVESQRMIASASALLQRRRRENSAVPLADRPSAHIEERLGMTMVYSLLERGSFVRGPYQPLGISGFREIHTYLFNTDPGEGHITVTCADLALMRGTCVHVEHIDRDKEFNKEKVEAYRLPAAINAAKVRLHVGSDAPTTAFIGRPVFESGAFRLDLLKSVHMTASACTAMFMNGIADCKIAIERMTVTESIEFMKAVVGNVIRDRSRQYLSAAFNINTPFLDDRPNVLPFSNGLPVRLTDRMDVARIGIAIARQAGFDKVTWDGASNQVPSRPIIGSIDKPGQLSHSQVCQLVHEAHEMGLNTYVSAGLDPVHMRDAVFAGLDGVGIGTSLHFIDPETKLMGALRAEKIFDALTARDEAEKSLMGAAAVLLARADRLFFEKTLPAKLNPARLELFNAVVARDEKAAVRARSLLADIEQMPMSRNEPTIEHARRFMNAAQGDSLVRQQFSEKEVSELVRDVQSLMNLGDLPRLAEVLAIPSAIN
jgi:ABC-type phosphate/phosphonate transport system substrate-binding protein